MRTTHLLLLFGAAATATLALGACGLVVTSGADGGGVCHTSAQSCEAPSDCCEGFLCLGGKCLFTGGGNDGSTGSNGSSGGSSVSGTTGHASGGSSGGSTHPTIGSTTGGTTGNTSGGTSSGSSNGSSTGGSSGSGTSAGSSSGGSSGGSTGNHSCAAYDQSCASEGCCAGLTCDSTYHSCYVSDGSPCTGAEAICATPDTCLSSGLCGTAPSCSPYGAQGCETSGLACCSGLTCDATNDACFVSLGDSCAGGYQCATPYSCLSDGTCGTAPTCSAYAAPCGTTGCCDGLSCDTDNDICYVADNYSCVDGNSVCVPPDTCQPSGFCGSSSCKAYGTYGCATGIPCCSGLTCDSIDDSCYVAVNEPCAGEACATPYTCLSSGSCGTSTCGAYASSNCAVTGCCSGLLCDSSGFCYVAPGYPCAGGETCANDYTCTYLSASSEYACEPPPP